MTTQTAKFYRSPEFPGYTLIVYPRRGRRTFAKILKPDRQHYFDLSLEDLGERIRRELWTYMGTAPIAVPVKVQS